MHYMDMTFCPYKECSKFDECHLALTDRVRSRAKVWWGGDDVPFSQYVEKPDCFKDKEVT
jgi:hypothetical protein